MRDRFACEVEGMEKTGMDFLFLFLVDVPGDGLVVDEGARVDGIEGESLGVWGVGMGIGLGDFEGRVG